MTSSGTRHTAQPIYFRWITWRIAPVFVIGACLTSNFIWDLHDQKVWDGDPSAYADSTLLLWDTRSLGLGTG